MIGHVSFQYTSTPAVPSDRYLTITVEQLLWTFVLHVYIIVCTKEPQYCIIKNFHFYSYGYSTANNNLTKQAYL